MPRPRLVYITTHPVTPALFLRGQLAYMVDAGFDVHVISSPGPDLDVVAEREGVTTHAVQMTRDVDPAADALALVHLTKLLGELKPQIVNASTPKAGLLGMVAARTVGVPIRIYLLRGLRLETTKGVLRQILSRSEQLASAAATEVVCVSTGLMNTYVPRFVSKDKCSVLAHGSSNGVQSERFAPSPENEQRAQELKKRLGLPDRFTIGFAGRLVADKGVEDLLSAFELLSSTLDAQLLLVGDDLGGDAVSDHTRQRIESMDKVTVLPRMSELGPFYALLDVLAFPSLREGFPNVPLEAAMAGLPVAGYASTGVTDAVVNGTTGLLVPTGDVEGLANVLLRYGEDPALRRQHGDAGHARALTDFAPHRIWSAWVERYDSRMIEAGLPPLGQPPLILHVLPYDLARGAQVYARALRDALDEPTQIHRTVTLFEGEPGILDPDYHLDVPRSPFRRMGYDPRASMRLADLLQRLSPSVIVTHGAEPLKYVLPVSGGLPVFHYRIGISSVREGPRARLLALQHRAADRVAGVSNETLEEAITLFGVDPARTLLIANGRDPERYHPQPKPDGLPLLTFLGAFAPTKRPSVFVDVVEELQKRGVAFEAEMIGDGALFHEVAPRAEALGIRVLGRREDVPDLLPRASVFLFTSIPEGEGMPGVFIEAGFCGVATVATRVPGASTVVEDGVTGFVVDPDALPELIDRTAQLLSSPSLAKQMGQAATQRCLKHFTLEIGFQRWRDALSTLLETQP